ncbi:hypothetical protein BH10PSE1_BH10PSE1_01340 [soil metagenome]
MTAKFVRLIPDRLFLLWLLVGVGVTFAFSIGGAAGLGFEATAIENGPQEYLEIALLLAASLTFLVTALFGKRSGAPVLMVLSLIFGLMGLREFETPIDNDFLYYLAGHAAREHWAILALTMTAWLAFRDRRWSFRQHMRGTGPVWVPLIGAAAVVVLGSVAEKAAGAAIPSSRLHDIMEWLEESLEVCGYVVAFVAAAWMWRLGRTVGDQTAKVSDAITFEAESR